MTIEKSIISNVLFNEEYYKKVIPYLKEDYFDEPALRKIYSSIAEYVEKYDAAPSREALEVILDQRKDLNETLFKEVMEAASSLKLDPDTDQTWLLNETERFCQDKDLYNSIRQSIMILDGKEKKLDKGMIPKLLSDSLGINFDTHIGHDYAEDHESRFEFYHRKEERLPFGIALWDKVTKGGLPRKSLNILMSETGVGKTLVMCHLAAQSFLVGKNVLYITAEMAEERIAERIDANLLDVTLDELKELPRASFEKRIERLKSKTVGKLIIKEYPTAVAHAGHFRHLLNDLRLKKGFVPDIIFIDYLNICASSRIKSSMGANSYTLVKSIAEEIRGLSMEFNVPIISATQANRGAYGSSDMDLTNTSESMGLPMSADSMFALISSEELREMGQIIIKQLKNRWGDIGYYTRFAVGIDRSKMKLYDLEENAQTQQAAVKAQDQEEFTFNTKSSKKPSFSGELK
ncbi:MAG: DnaB-like helicase C-terminal domain-containing protein [Anaerolineaceae bacterium]